MAKRKPPLPRNARGQFDSKQETQERELAAFMKRTYGGETADYLPTQADGDE